MTKFYLPLLSMKNYIILSILFLLLSSCLDNVYPPLIITGAVTNIDKDGAVFHTKITDLGKSNVLDFGFVWDTIHNPTIENAEKYIFDTQAEIGNYEAKISGGLIAFKTYYVRAFIRNAEVTTYGQETSFVSNSGKSPEIISISPLTGNLGDTLLVVGKYFSSRSINIKINQINAEIIKSAQDSIYAIIPSTLIKKTSEIILVNLNQTITAKDSFSLISPVINSFEAKTGTYGDEVNIKGKNFLRKPSTVKVFFDKILADFQIIDDQTIKAIVPEKLDNANCFISVSMNNQATESVDMYSLLPVEITDSSPKTALTGGKITITGKYFSPILTNNKVYIGGVLAKPIAVTKNTLEVSLSLQDTAVYESRNATVKVNVMGNIRTFEDKLLINDKWFRRANAPESLKLEYKFCSTCTPYYNYENASSFVIGKTAYIGLNDKKEFWAYDTEKNTWKKCADFPGTPRTYGTGFVFENKIYFGKGYSGRLSTNATKLNDWWEYNSDNDKWTKKADCGGYLHPISGWYTTGDNPPFSSFSTINGCYFSGGFYYDINTGYHQLDIWKYNPEADTWVKMDIDVNNLKAHSTYWEISKVVNDEVFIGFGDDGYGNFNNFYIFNTSKNTFKSITKFPYDGHPGSPVYMVLNNTIYIQTEESKNFYYYDRTTNSWKYTETKIYTDPSIGFEVGNIGFVGLGQSNHLYEYDPSR